MPRIAPIDTAHAAAEVQATLSAVKAKIGMVPNLFTTFAQSPAVLNGYLGFSGRCSPRAALTAKQREIIALAVAQANGCHYCLSAHTLMGKGAGLDARRRPCRPPRQGAGRARQRGRRLRPARGGGEEPRERRRHRRRPVRPASTMAGSSR